MTSSRWWESWWLLAAVALLTAVPLILPETPPLVDLPGHIGRYRIQLDLDSSGSLQRFYEFEWSLIGNLGVDLLVIPLAPLLGLERAVKLIVITIPILTAAGIFWTAREVHGRVPPTIFFAMPFIYAYPFNFGFINFALSQGLALLGLALWIRLGRQERTALRAALFVPMSCVIWLVHAFGWGMLGLTAWSAELVRQHDKGNSWVKGAVMAGMHSLALALPLLLMILWRSGNAAGFTGGFLALDTKAYSLLAVLRDRWLIWDSYGLAIALVLIGAAAMDQRFEFGRRLAVPALVLAAIYFLLPRMIFGSAYADMRLAPLMLLLGIAAIRPAADQDLSFRKNITLLGLLFLVVRVAGNTASFLIADREAQERLGALSHIPQHARVLFLAGDFCEADWRMPRHTHMGAFVITRRLGFTNDQWQISGSQLLRVNYPPAGDFVSDPSGLVYSEDCLAKARGEGEVSSLVRSAEEAVSDFPREGFDFVWMIRPPDFEMVERDGLVPIWRGRDSILYRVGRSEGASASDVIKEGSYNASANFQETRAISTATGASTA